MMENELKPCECSKLAPMVGQDWDLDEDLEGYWYAGCAACGSRGPLRETEDLAIAAWNARAGVDAGEAERLVECEEGEGDEPFYVRILYWSRLLRGDAFTK